MITVTKNFRFEAAHYLPNYDGCCKHLHGHSYLLEITVKRIGCDTDSNNDMVIDFSHLKAIVQSNIIARLDHAYLNDILKNPVAENIVKWIVTKLQSVLPSEITLHHIRLWETHNSHADWSIS